MLLMIIEQVMIRIVTTLRVARGNSTEWIEQPGTGYGFCFGRISGCREWA